MGIPNKWAVREVGLATFYSLQDGHAMLYLDTLKTSGLENSAKTVYARGGRGNAKLLGFSSDREGKVSLQDCVFSNEALAMMSGNELITGSQQIYKREVLTVMGGKATLLATPTGGHLISAYILNPDGSHGLKLTEMTSPPTTGKYSISAKALTLSASDVPDGTRIVVYYKTGSGASSKAIEVKANSFAGSFKLTLDCLVRDLTTKQDYQAQIIIPNCKMEDNWKFAFSADGEPSVFDIPIEILSNESGDDMWTMVVYDQSELA